MIEVSGNKLLSESDYLKFAKLNELSIYSGLTLPAIKERFEKHPYLDNVDVEYAGNGLVKVFVTERIIMAVIINNGEPYFITENFQILPMLNDTKYVDLPVISNANVQNKITALFYQKSDDIIEAFKIIEAAKLSSVELSKKLSEIDLRNGGEIILSFSGIKSPVIFGKGDDAKKMIYLENMMDGMVNGNNFVESSNYIDLRFANEIFLGKSEETGLSE
ncbi:MAG: cell division protein FtsQ/DivIB [Ignavibacteriaceae bacterium]